jgi:hypothetical protein
MVDVAIRIREGGFASLAHHGRLYKREPGSDGRPHWSEGIADRHKPVSVHRARRYERIYRHPKEVKPFRRFPRLESGLKPGQPVFHATFGYGKVAETDGDEVTVRFGKKKGRVRTREVVTRAQAEENWHNYWLRGTERRLEEGKRLGIVKSLCRFGEWQAFLEKYGLSRSTCDDLIARFKAQVAESQSRRAKMPGNRAIDMVDRHGNERDLDSDADEREELVRRESAKRHGRVPSHHKTLWSIRIKLPADVLSRCHKKYKEPGSKEFWRRAAYQFVGLNPDAPEAATEQKTGNRHHGKKHHLDRNGA